VVDHIVPLCAGGAGTPANMQWQTVANAKAKDVQELKFCTWIRSARERGAERKACEIRLRAERRADELLQQMASEQRRQTGG
jgi:hypothetical protein